jgi:hypothetical protein
MSDVPETHIVLTMETVSTSETNINLDETIGRNIPEDTHLVYFCIYFLHAQSLKIQLENCLKIQKLKLLSESTAYRG